MSWQAYFPTRVFFGQGVVRENAKELSLLGSKALIVTGKGGSSSRNGALADVQAALEKAGVAWDLFDQIEANPDVEVIRKGSAIAASAKADFVIGIGGGSAMDAAKAIAITNVGELSNSDLLARKYEDVLPIVAVATTAGTGAEVTSASILTVHEEQTKKNIGGPKLMPKLAFLDPSYTHNLAWQLTADHAVDAFSHALESHLSFRNSTISSLFSQQAMTILGKELKMLSQQKEPNAKSRKPCCTHLILPDWLSV